MLVGAERNYYGEEKDHHEVVCLCTGILGMQPTCAKACLLRALAHQALGNYPAAIADYTELLTIEPGHAEASAGLQQTQAMLVATERPSVRSCGR